MSNHLYDIVNEVREGRITSIEELEERYPDEMKAYPVLLKSIFRKDFDWKIYDNMKKTKLSVDSDEITLDQASEKIGGDLVDKYVKPLIQDI
jgi:hypothetical protein